MLKLRGSKNGFKFTGKLSIRSISSGEYYYIEKLFPYSLSSIYGSKTDTFFNHIWGTNIGNYVCFGGSYEVNNQTNSVIGFDKNLSMTKAQNLNKGKSVPFVSDESHMLGMGGYYNYNGSTGAYDNVTDCYNLDLTKTSVSNLTYNSSDGRSRGMIGTDNRFFIIAGGWCRNTSSISGSLVSPTTNLYNAETLSMTTGTISKYNTSSTQKRWATEASLRNGNFVVGGGYINSSPYKNQNTVEMWNSDGTRVDLSPLTVSRRFVQDCTIDKYCIIIGGADDNVVNTKAYDIYDEDGVKISSGILEQLSTYAPKSLNFKDKLYVLSMPNIVFDKNLTITNDNIFDNTTHIYGIRKNNGITNNRFISRIGKALFAFDLKTEETWYSI